jgi:hypothetical protein
MGKYFNVTVKPTIAASKQHIGAFTAADVLFDWVAFDIPKGGARCIGATLLVRPKGDATPSKNDFGVWFIVSSSNDVSLGTANDSATKRPSNDFIGILEIGDQHSYVNLLNSTNIGATGRATNNETQHPSFVVARNAGSDGNGANVGYDRFYLGAMANGAFDFSSINAIAEDTAADAAASQVITMDGSSMDVREHFIAGDVLHIGTTVGTPAADSLIGTVASADSATQITLEDVSPTALVDGDILYNIHPMRIILHFEQ